MKIFKKFLSVFLAALSLISFCACGADKDNVSSAITESEDIKNEISSVIASEEIKNSSKIETSSLKQETSSKEEVASEESSSKKTAIDRNSSQTESDGVKVYANSPLQIGMHGFTPQTCDNYGKEIANGFKEFEDVIKEGYVNTICASTAFEYKEFWDIVEKYDLTVWYSSWDIFKSSEKTIEEHAATINKRLEYVKSNPSWWERFNGFWYDEKVWRGETNDDFLTETKYFYQKYGKRNFTVLATGEFTGVEGNEEEIGMSAVHMKKILPYAFEYMTDVAYDSYGVDVRPDVNYSSTQLAEWQTNISKDITSGRTYYSELTKLLLRLVGHDVNVWYYPRAYTTSSKGSEAFCLAHLEFFAELLMEQKHQGGIFLYVYQDGSKSDGLETYLVVDDENGNQTVKPDEEKWTYYSAALKKIVEKFNSTEANLSGYKPA